MGLVKQFFLIKDELLSSDAVKYFHLPLPETVRQRVKYYHLIFPFRSPIIIFLRYHTHMQISNRIPKTKVQRRTRSSSAEFLIKRKA